MSSIASLFASGLFNIQAATPVGGFALQNGTPTILTWNVPNDGKLHVAFVVMLKHVTAAETGGAITLSYNTPDGTPNSHTPFAGGGLINTLDEEQDFPLVQAGAVLTLAQSSALTVGASKLWAQIWGF